MATQHSIPLPSIFLFMLTFFYLHSATIAVSPASSPTAVSPASSPTAASPASSPTGHQATGTSDSNTVQFIREYCGDTLYPDVCFSSLQNHADTIKEDPVLLVRVAINVSHNKARSFASYLNGTDSGPASGLQDCFSGVNDALEEIRQSVKEFRRVSSSFGQAKAKEQISNIQTWLSSAMTNVDSCTEGLKGVKDATVQTNVGNQVKEVNKLISIALALVNRFANQANMS